MKLKASILKKLRELNPMPTDTYTPGDVYMRGTKWECTAEENWDHILTDWYNGYKAGYKKFVLKANPDFKMP